MALITHAYFEEGDFSKVSLLEDTYHHLNSCMSCESQIPPQIFVGNYELLDIFNVNENSLNKHLLYKRI